MILKIKLAQTLASLFGLDIIKPFEHYEAWFSLRHKHNGGQKTHNTSISLRAYCLIFGSIPRTIQ